MYWPKCCNGIHKAYEKIDQYTTMSFLHSLKKHVGSGNIHYGITLQLTTQNMYTALGEGSSNIPSILAGANIV
jgi:hypothetical protein